MAVKTVSKWALQRRGFSERTNATKAEKEDDLSDRQFGLLIYYYYFVSTVTVISTLAKIVEEAM